MTPRSEFKRRLLAAAPEGARVIKRGRHPKLVIERPGELVLKVPFPSSPSGSPRGIKNAVAGIRRLLKEGEK